MAGEGDNSDEVKDNFLRFLEGTIEKQRDGNEKRKAPLDPIEMTETILDVAAEELLVVFDRLGAMPAAALLPSTPAARLR